MSGTRGETKWRGPELGKHTEEVMREWLDYEPERISELKERGVL
ncbi:hypothetical protein [Halobacillus salinarum]|nr:hypothetical protein [Halobacillus salinarum]